MDTNGNINTNNSDINDVNKKLLENGNDIPKTDKGNVDEDQKTVQDKPKSKDCGCFGMFGFVCNVSVLLLLYMMTGVYNVGVVRTIEKRFGLPSSKTGLMMSCNDISHILIIIFVGYFGRTTHKPKFICITMMFSVVAMALMTLPYFIYSKTPIPYMVGNISTYIGDEDKMQFCDGGNSSATQCDKLEDAEMHANINTYYIFIIAQFLCGIGGTGITTLGLAYIDENSSPEKSSLYVGIATSMFGVGPIFGLLLAALCTSLPETLVDVGLTRNDPNWIGAWWLGYGCLSILIFICALPMFWFPKHMGTAPQKSSTTVKASQTSGTENEKSLVEQIKDFPIAMVRVLRNTSFLMLLFHNIFGIFVISGVFINIPRYLELHFRVSASQSNVYAAVPAISGVVGGFLGGVLMNRRKIQAYGASKLVVFSSVITVTGIVVLMLLRCPPVNMAGMETADGGFTVDTICSGECSCQMSKNMYDPVCGSDGYSYFSPCHAGCTQELNGTFTDCHCSVSSNTTSLTVTPGTCEGVCSMLQPFAATLFLMSFLSSIGRVPQTILQFRVVEDDDRSFALGLTSFAINLFGFIPGPPIFGAVIDSTCKLWDRSCGARGSCILFDIDKFRNRTYGISVLFVALSLIFAVLLCYFVRRRSKRENEDPVVGEKEVNAESGLIAMNEGKIN